MEIQYHQLVNYFNNHSDAEEVQLIEMWRKDNEEDFQKWKNVWEKSDQIAQTNLPDLDLNWQKVEAKIQKPISFQKKGNPRKIFLYGLAASIALLIAVGITFYQLQTVRYEAQVANTLVQLPDGSKVWLYKGSSLEYPQSFFGKNKREVYLEGEGYFDVQRNEAKPFQIQGKIASVKVLGTSFLLNLPKDTTKQSVQVNSGRVAFYKNNQINDRIILTKGEQGALKDGSQTPEKSNIKDVNFMSWHTKKLIFNTTPLRDVFEQIEKVYSIEFNVVNEELLACTLTTTFENQDLEDIFLALETIYHIKFQSNSTTNFEVSGTACN